MDARFQAGWRPSRGQCAFGGETALLAAHCARVNFGAEGALAVLRAENSAILRSAGRLPCMAHVALARAALEPYSADYHVEPVYSCDSDAPVQDGRKVCHVSLLVRDAASGARFVMDNGHVLDPEVWRGVAAYGAFRERVDQAWIGDEPGGVRLAHD